MITISRQRRMSRTLPLPVLLFVGGWLLLAGAVRAQSTPAPGAPAAEPSPCEVSTRTWARPEIVQASAQANVTASIEFSCPSDPSAQTHIALVLDASSSITGATRASLIGAMDNFVTRLGLGRVSRVRVAVIQFNATASVLCELTDQSSALHACLARLASYDSSCIDCGIQAAQAVLARGRATVPAGAGVTESMIVFTDGANAAGCEALATATAAAKSDRIRIISIALSPGADVPCMRAAATAPRYFFEARAASQLSNVMDTIRRVLTGGNAQQVSIRFELAPGVRYVDDSAEPDAWLSDSNVLEWFQLNVPQSDMTVTFAIRPTVAGAIPVLASAAGELIDSEDRVAPIDFEIPSILALGGGVLPTATPQAAMPVRTNGLTLSPPNPKAGERAQLDYRLMLDDPIDSLGSHMMLVADQSGSMGGEAVDTLKSVLRDLVARLPLGSDPAMKVGLVAFNSAGKLLTGLTDDREAIATGIGRIGAAGGTCIDCGMSLGESALAGGRPAPGVEDFLVFTDGENNSGCPPLLAIADRLKADEVTVHVVCLVPGGCDTACMRAVASPGHYLEVPRITALAGAFESVGDVILSDRRLDAVQLRLLLPDHLRLVPDTFDIAPSTSSASEGDWTVRPWPHAGLTLHGQVEAIAADVPGAPAVALAQGISRDGKVVARSVAEASAPGPTDVPPPPPTTVTSTASAATPTTPIATPTAVAGWYVYLPIAYR